MIRGEENYASRFIESIRQKAPQLKMEQQVSLDFHRMLQVNYKHHIIQGLTDIFYSLKTTVGEGYIHVQIEHQSTPDKHMAFRLIRYLVAAMQRHLETGHKKLPLVISVLVFVLYPVAG